MSKQALCDIIKNHFKEQLEGISVTSVATSSYTDNVIFDLEPSFEFVFPVEEKTATEVA